MLNPKILAFIVSEITAFIRTDINTSGQTEIDSASNPDQEYIYFISRKRILLLSGDSIIPFYSTCDGYNYLDDFPNSDWLKYTIAEDSKKGP